VIFSFAPQTELLRKPASTSSRVEQRLSAVKVRDADVEDVDTPVRCSARSTKGQWKSTGSKTNMGGLGFLVAIRQERNLPG
jgi:hypothetical protein